MARESTSQRAEISLELPAQDATRSVPSGGSQEIPAVERLAP